MTTASAGSIVCTIDFERPGKQLSDLRLSHSDNVNGYGTIPIPIAVIGNGAGPTVLLSAGVHGDEYEGQILLADFARDVDPSQITGRLFILPGLNRPAVLAASRTSPLDGLNLNRVFPGDAAGPPTRAIAHFLDQVLLPLCDAGIDFHSGGTASTYLSCVYLCETADADLARRNRALAEAFGAPFAMLAAEARTPTDFDATAHLRHRIPFISTELAGAAQVDPTALAIGRIGLERALRHLGVLKGAPATATPPTRFLRIDDDRGPVRLPFAGVVEPLVRLGDMVEIGQPVARVHPLDDPWRPAATLLAGVSGVVSTLRSPAYAPRGGFAMEIALLEAAPTPRVNGAADVA